MRSKGVCNQVLAGLQLGALLGAGLTLGVGLTLGGCAKSEGLGAELILRAVKVVSDPDRDGRLAPGERADLQVTVVNIGTDSGSGSTCTVTSLTSGVALDETRDADLYFGYCNVDAACDDKVTVVVDASVAPGTVAEFACAADPKVADQAADGLRFSVTIGEPDVVLAIEDLKVLDDADRDGVLNPGESARIAVTLRNVGTSDLTPSRCVVGTGSPGVVVQTASETLEYRHCEAGDTCGTGEFRINLSPEVRAGTDVDFRCALVDAAERTWPISLKFRVEAPAARPRLTTVVVDDDDRDGQLNPGEGGRLQVGLRNIGVAALPSSSCTVTSEVAWLTVQTAVDTLDYSYCAADADCRTASFRVRADAEAPPGGSTTLTCALEDDRGLRYEVLIPLTLGQ